MEFAQWTDPMDNFKAKSDAITSELKSGFNDFTTGVEKDF